MTSTETTNTQQPLPPIIHQPWCTDHPALGEQEWPGQCSGDAIKVAEHCYVWLTQTDDGTRVVIDGPPSGVQLTLQEMGVLHTALGQIALQAIMVDKG